MLRQLHSWVAICIPKSRLSDEIQPTKAKWQSTHYLQVLALCNFLLLAFKIFHEVALPAYLQFVAYPDIKMKVVLGRPTFCMKSSCKTTGVSNPTITFCVCLAAAGQLQSVLKCIQSADSPYFNLESRVVGLKSLATVLALHLNPVIGTLLTHIWTNLVGQLAG